MARKYGYNSARSRNKRRCNGWKNWDTWTAGAVISNDYKAYNYVKKNKSKLLKMKKNDKLRAIHRNSDVGLSNISYRNVSAKELNYQIRNIDE